MNTGELFAILTFSLAIAGVVYAMGKQSNELATNSKDINAIGRKLDKEIEVLDTRIDNLTRFYVRLSDRIANLERHNFGEERNNTIPNLRDEL